MTYLVTETATTGDWRRARSFLTRATAQKFADRSPYFYTEVVEIAEMTNRRTSLYAVRVRRLNEERRNLTADIMRDATPPAPKD